METIDTRAHLGARSHVYDAFSSYSHAADRSVVPRLQAALQRFAKPLWKRRAVRIVRDELSLAANPDLWSSIEDALRYSLLREISAGECLPYDIDRCPTLEEMRARS